MSKLLALFSYAIRDASKSRVVLFLIIISLSVSSAAVFTTTAILDGFKKTLTDGAVNTNGHIVIMPPGNVDGSIPNVNDVVAKISRVTNVEGLSIRSYSLGSVKAGDKTAAAYAIIGVPDQFEAQASKIPDEVIDGRFIIPNNKPEIVLGKSIADALVGQENDGEFVHPDDDVTVTFYNGKQGSYKVVGIVDAKNFYSNWMVFFNKTMLEQIDTSKKDSQIAVRLADDSKLEQTKQDIEDLGLDVTVQTWKENASYISDIINAVEFITLTISRMLIFAVFIIICIVVFITVSQKRRQIGIMKSMGAGNKFIIAIFLIQTLVYSILAFILGFLLFVIIHLWSTAHPISLLIGDFSTALEQKSIITTTVILFIAAIAGSFLPGYMASKTSIADIIIDRK